MRTCVSRRAASPIAAARHCRGGQRPTRFTEVKPSEGEKGSIVNLAEEAEYTEEQARDAGIQRLLVVAGYDANPIDGMRGDQDRCGAHRQFLHDNKLSVDLGGALGLLRRAARRRAEGRGHRPVLVQRHHATP